VGESSKGAVMGISGSVFWEGGGGVYAGCPVGLDMSYLRGWLVWGAK